MNRAERRKNNQRVISNRLKELKQLNDSRYNHLKDKRNILSKQDAFDCGQTCCPLCSGEKLYGDKDNKGYKKTQSNTIKDNEIILDDLLDIDLDFYNYHSEV